jgi:site-specific recombinase XerD
MDGAIASVNFNKKLKKRWKIEKRVSPHIMRASRATHLLDNGASDMYVSEFLGHSKLQTTKDYYCKLTIKGMQDNFDKVDDILKRAA